MKCPRWFPGQETATTKFNLQKKNVFKELDELLFIVTAFIGIRSASSSQLLLIKCTWLSVNTSVKQTFWQFVGLERSAVLTQCYDFLESGCQKQNPRDSTGLCQKTCSQARWWKSPFIHQMSENWLCNSNNDPSTATVNLQWLKKKRIKVMQ